MRNKLTARGRDKSYGHRPNGGHNDGMDPVE